MGKPFEVYVDYGAASPLKYTISEDLLREHRHHAVQSAILQQGPDDTDERIRLWRGALEIIRGMLEKNAAQPVRIFDGPDVWMIPDHAIRSVRLHDPESPDKRGTASIGFRREAE
jgi:hypothetical protein